MTHKHNKLLKLTDFERKVLEFTDKIPKGRVSTYKLIAEAMGKPNASRAVGNALNKNPLMVTIPCHRVICSNGDLGGFGGGPDMKLKILTTEGLTFNKNHRLVNLQKSLYNFS